MNNDLEQFSEERLKDIIELADNPTMVSLARIALSAKQANPVAWITWHQGCRAPDDCENYLNAYTYKTEEKSVDGSDAFPVYTTPQPAHTEQGNAVANEFLPENLDRALTIMGVALPESKEEFNFQAERWVQRLINRVIRYESELHTEVNSPAIPDGWKLVPIEPTEEMINAWDADMSQSYARVHAEQIGEDEVVFAYQAMLAAAPKPESE